MKFLVSFFFFAIVVCGGWAQAQSQKAVVINEGALVYVQPDFDAELLTELKAGTVYDISLKTKGPFYKIRVRPKITGWVADTDVKVGKFKGAFGSRVGGALPAKSAGSASVGAASTGAGAASKNKKSSAAKVPAKKDATEAASEKPEPKKKVRSFERTRFRGPTVAYLTYNEDTMGALRQQNLPFFGLKVEGNNTLFSGDMRTAGEIIFHPGAPDYYTSLTGTQANGWVFITDFIFETALPQSAWHMVTFGFGPMFKYTHYEVTLQENARPVSYSLDDMALGAVFDGGLVFRLGAYALHFNVKYYWEKTKYWGGSLTFGFPF